MRIAAVIAAGAAGSMMFASVGCGQAQQTPEAAAVEEAAEPAAPKWSKASLMGDLLDNEETAAVFDEHLPGVPLADYRSMIAQMSLEELAQNPQAYMILEKLDEIDADLQAIK